MDVTLKKKLSLGAVFLVTAFGLFALTSQPAGATPSQRNKPPVIQSFTSSLTDLYLCPVFPHASCGYIVELEVKADDPNSDKLAYRYWVSGGRIVGSGARVVWDLRRGPTLGQQTARVEVTDGRGGKTTSSVSLNVRICPNCDYPGCPAVAVTGVDNINGGEVAVFTVTVSSEYPLEKMRYTWRVTNGKILKGQRSRRLVVRALAAPGDEITATVMIEGLDPTCGREASGSSRIQKRSQ